MARIVPYAAVHFGSYEWYRQALVDRLSTRGLGNAPVSPVWDLLAGSAAGGTAVLITYPLDLVRTKFKLLSHPTCGLLSTSSGLFPVTCMEGTIGRISVCCRAFFLLPGTHGSEERRHLPGRRCTSHRDCLPSGIHHGLYECCGGTDEITCTDAR